MEPKDNLYSKTEGILYSYPRLTFEIKNLEIEIKMIENEYTGIKGKSDEIASRTNAVSSSVENEVISKEARIDALKRKINHKRLLIEKIDNAIDAIAAEDETSALLIKLKYIKHLEWKQIEMQIPMDEKSLMRKRSKIIKDKLIGMLA